MGESEWSVASAIARNVLKESEIDHSILNGVVGLSWRDR